MMETGKENVVYGMIDLREEREAAYSSWKYVRDDLSDIKNRYISLGFHLAEIERMGYYEDFGYENFYEFCEANFKMDKSAVSRCINVWREFSLVQNGNHKMFLDEKYRNYGYSQLCELLPLDEKQRREITPDMSVKQIREKKKEWKTKSKKKKVAMSQQGEKQQEEENANCQPELPVMKNMKEREDFVNSYKNWNIWCRNDETEQVFYRYDLPDGFAIIVLNYPIYIEWSKKESEEHEFYLLPPDYRHVANCKSNMTSLKEHLKNMQK